MAQLCVFSSPFLPLFSPPSLKATLDVVMNLQFHYIEKLWQTFWCATAPSSDGNTTINNRSLFAAAFTLNLTRKMVTFKIAFFLRSTFGLGGTVTLCAGFLCSDDEVEGAIPREKLVALCKYEPVRLWMRSCDHILYQALVEILIPDVLRPVPSE